MTFGDLENDLTPDRVEFGDVFGCDFFLLSLALFFRFIVTDNFDTAVIGGREDVPVVKEGIFWLSNINKGSLESVFQILDTSFKDRADFAGIAGTLDLKFFKNPVS